MEQIELFQKHLLLIRRAVGWSAERFGDKVGVTRATINNLESGRTKLSKTLYIAMRSVLDVEIKNYPDETKTLQLILETFVDHPEKYSEEDKKKFLDKLNILTPSVLAGAATRKDVSAEAMKFAIGSALAAVTPAVIGVGLATATWLIDLLDNDK